MAPLLSVRDLSVSFVSHEGSTLAVDGLSYDISGGEMMALVGESGCGKTVSALALTGLVPASARVSGSALLDGRELLSMGEDELRSVRGSRIGYVFQDPMTSLNPVLTVGRHILEVLREHVDLTGRAARRRACELLEMVGIPDAAAGMRAYPHQFSGGMRQRVMIAAAIACEPDLLIADEPTTALDVTVQAGILELLGDLRSSLRSAVVLITHDLAVVANTADTVVVMYAGRKVESGPTARVLATPAHPYTQGLMAAIPSRGQRARQRRLSAIPGSVPTLSGSPDRCTFSDRCPHVIDPCRTSTPPPVDVAPDQEAACWRAEELLTVREVGS